MAATRPQFEAAPLVEAVFDCFAEQAAEAPQLPALEQSFFSGFGEYGESTREEWHLTTSRIEFKRGRATAYPAAEISGIRRWRDDRSRGVLVGPAVLALNVKPPYGHFEDHLPHLKELTARFIELGAPARLQWLGHRYVNQVEVGLDEELTAADLFTLYPRVPTARAKSHPPMAVQMEVARFDGGSVMTTLALAAKLPQKVIYSLDIYARTDHEVEVNAEAVAEWHMRAHRFIMDAFLGSITEVARRRFKEKSP
jgi:uncharacterized protein (TIGR04255 family)